jgi:phage terminase large subunit-like protein
MKARIPRLDSVPIDFPTLGWALVDWIETFLCHGPGPVAGQDLELDTEFVQHICWAYRLDDQGSRCFDRVVISRPKGRAKSELQGMLACAELLAPVRFDHWAEEGEVSEWGYQYNAGEPVGRRIVTPFLRLLATEEGQTGNTYGNVREMLGKDRVKRTYPELARADAVGATRTVFPGATGEIRPSTSGAASKDGGKETWAGADEEHLYVLPELREMLETVERNLMKLDVAEEPWLHSTTTMFAPGQDSMAERSFDLAEQLGTFDAMLGARFLMDHREAPEIEDWDDDDEIAAALVDVYGPFAPRMNPKRMISNLRKPQTRRATWQRYWLNQRVTGSGRWLDTKQWAELYVTTVTPSGELVCAGFDGSRFDDATAIVIASADNVLENYASWEPPVKLSHAEDDDPYEIDETDVENAMSDLFDEFTVVRLYADPYYWETNVAKWAEDHGAAVTPWRTNRPTVMAKAIHAFETAVRGRELHHTGDPVLDRHIANAVTFPTRIRLEDKTYAHTISKDRRDSPRKIDAAVTAVLAWEALRDARTAGDIERARKNRRRGFRF